MTQEHARLSYERYCAKEKRAALAAPRIEQRNEAWLFFEVEEGEGIAASGVVVRPDGEAFQFRGALGRLFNLNPGVLGNPKSNELVLGATEFGRYQAFDRGVAIWDGGTSYGFLLIESLSSLDRQTCIVAFFDLRRFTSWSGKNPDEAQKAIRAFEEAVRVGFPTDDQPWLRLFIKGTGDGVMIVSQADWYQDDKSNRWMPELKRGHGKNFFENCQRTLSEGRKNLEKYPLAIGCAIASGPLDRVFLFGRLDYIGPAANDAAKLQQHASDEICVTCGFREALKRDGETLDGELELPSNGWRLRSA